MSKQVIPISMIEKRSNTLFSVEENQVSFNPTALHASAINGLKNCKFEPIKKFLTECTRGYLAPRVYWETCYDDISKMSEWEKEKEVLEAQNIFLENILPKVFDLDTVKSYAATHVRSEAFATKVNEACEVLSECDRVIRNHTKLSSRFNFTQIIRESDDMTSSEDTIETLCELVDTYDIPVAAKLNTALENVLYSYDKLGINVNRAEVIQTITEYFLRYNNVITDSNYTKICKVLEDNKFISREDINRVHYLFTEQRSFNEKVEVASSKVDSRYKTMSDKLNNCKTLAVAKTLIKEAFDLIWTTFVVAGVVTFATVVVLIAAMFGLIIRFAASPLIVLKQIKDENKRINASKLAAEEKERAEKVVKYINQKIAEAEANPVKEAANMIDSMYIAPELNTSSGIKFESVDMEVFNELTSYIIESKDFADSSDVKDIIKKYKAEQNKNEGRFKMAISHIYTKKPQKIIDDTPNILEFIRNFGILSTLAINPILAVVIFCVDKFIELGLKRKEADRVLKYFKAEKIKVEKKIDKLKDGDKKDRLEDYSKCLDRAIEKLEDYRDNLYTDKELDTIRDLEEAANVNYFDKLSVEEYFDNKHGYVRSNISRAVQLFYNEFLRKFAKPYIEMEEYELFDGEKITITFDRIDEETLIKLFVTPDGMINVPLFRIKYTDPDATDPTYLFTDITQSCSFVNEFLSSDCIITNYLENDNIYILFNYLKCLYVEDREDIDYSLTFEARQQIATLLALAESVEEIEKLYPMDTMKDLFKNIEKICSDDIDTVVKLVTEGMYMDQQFVDTLKDLRATTEDPIISTNIMTVLESINKSSKNNYTIIESSLVQAEAIKLLHSIVEEAKVGSKKPVTAVKDKIANGAQKKTSITTNLGLAAQVLKKKAQNFSTKEKEVSRNVDINLSVFKKNIEKSLTTNKRESIIRGSVIPSFSKIIKSGMVAGGLYLVNPVLAAIGVVGALAVSKALTARERQMLLDEIDIELKAVEKEISMAESNNRMKEYRHLMMYQRKLQREKQRIKYRIKVYGKDNIPDVKGED